MSDRLGAGPGSNGVERRRPHATRVLAICVASALILQLLGCSADTPEEIVPSISSAPAASGPVVMECIIAREGLIPGPGEWGGTAYRLLDSPWQYELIELVVPLGSEVVGVDGSQIVLDLAAAAGARGENVTGRATITGVFTNGGSRVTATRIELLPGTVPEVEGPPVLPATGDEAGTELIASGDVLVIANVSPQSDARWLTVTIPSAGNPMGMSAQVIQYAVVDRRTEIRGALGHARSIEDVLSRGIGSDPIWATVELQVQGGGVHVRRITVGG